MRRIKFTKKDEERAYQELRSLLKEGDTVYTILRHVSRSGLSRRLDALIIKDNEPRFISALIAAICDHYPFYGVGEGIRVDGVGMDVGSALVYDLSYKLFGNGYALRHRWL